MSAYEVRVVGGLYDGERVTSALVPWAGTLEEANALVAEMREQARLYLDIAQDYEVVEVGA